MTTSELRNEFSHFDEYEINVINIVSKVFSSFSIAGSLLIFILYWFFKENRSFNLELVLWYGLSNTICLVTHFLPFDPFNEDAWCAVQSFLLTWFQIAGMIWTCIIAYSAFISVIKKNHIENNKCKYRTAFVLISFGVSALLASMSTYGSSGGWCWMDIYSNEERPIVYKLVLFYFCIQWFFIILNCFFIYKVISILKANRNSRNEHLMSVYSVMKWYPIVQTVFSLPATINRLYDIITKENNFGLMVLQTICDCIEGCFITIIFLMSPEIKHSLWICFNKLFFRTPHYRNLDDTSLVREYSNSIPSSEYSITTPNDFEKDKKKINKINH